MTNKKSARIKDTAKEQTPPPVAIGHVTLRVSAVAPAAEFYEALGLRPILNREELAILELRGGTHLVLFRSRGKPKPGPVRGFDFMVEDIEAAHAAMKKVAVRGTAICEDRLAGHLWFEVTDPDGHVLKVFSSHTGGGPCDLSRAAGEIVVGCRSEGIIPGAQITTDSTGAESA